MGQIFLGKMAGPAGFERPVVIKRILPHLSGSEEFVQRFIDEARIVVQLQHGNIVPVFEMGQEAGEYYIAMEYLPGWDLKTVLQRCTDRQQPFPIPLALLIGVEVARGLAYAHRKCDDQGRELAIVHRDVSPSNILLGRDGVVKITDFGIAKAASKMVDSVSGMLRGKFGYMSPEQAVGGSLDRRSDIFSLGVVLWEVLAGQRLFEADSDTAILRKIQVCQVNPPSSVRPEIPPEVDGPILRALARDRRARFATADELEQELTGLLVRRFPGTTSSGLSAFLGGIFPGEFPGARPPTRPSFDDLLRAGLEDLAAEIDPDASTFTSSPGAEGGSPSPPPGTRSLVPPGPPGGPAVAPPPGSWPGAAPPGSWPSAPAPGSWPPSTTPPGSWPGEQGGGQTQPVGRWPGIRRSLLIGLLLGLLLAGSLAGGSWWLSRRDGGTLEVGAKPPAAWVVVDGIWVAIDRSPGGRGTSPLVIQRLPAGPAVHSLAVHWPGYEPWSKTGVTLPLALAEVPRPTRTVQEETAQRLGLGTLSAEQQRLRALYHPHHPGVRGPEDLPRAWLDAAAVLLAGEAATLPSRVTGREAVPPGGRPGGRVLPTAPGKPLGRPSPPPVEAAPLPLGWVKARCLPYGILEVAGRTFEKGATGEEGIELPVGPTVLQCHNPDLGLQKSLTVVVQPRGRDPQFIPINLEK